MAAEAADSGCGHRTVGVLVVNTMVEDGLHTERRYVRPEWCQCGSRPRAVLGSSHRGAAVPARSLNQQVIMSSCCRRQHEQTKWSARSWRSKNR